MVRVKYDDNFLGVISKIKDSSVKRSINNKIAKIIKNPLIGKPMSFGRKGTRELYLGSYRLSYKYYVNEDLLEFLDLYHKKKQ